MLLRIKKAYAKIAARVAKVIAIAAAVPARTLETLWGAFDWMGVR